MELLIRDNDAWNELLESIYNLYGVKYESTETGLRLDPPDFLSELDADLKLPADPDGAERLPFSYLHVEPLLNQAADLLDRAISDRTEWNSLRVQATSLWLEILEFLGTDKVHQREQEAGIYEIAHKRSLASLEAERLSADPLERLHHLAAEQLNLDFSDRAKADEVILRTHLAYLNACPATWSKGLSMFSEGSVPSVAKRELPWLGEESRKVHGNENHWKMMKVAQYEQEAAARSVNQGGRTAASQEARTLMEKLRSDAMMSGLEAEERWEDANRTFRKERSQVARDVMDLRIRETARLGGSLNFVERMVPVKERFSADFREAEARLTVVARGLQLLYDYTDPLPKPSIDGYVGWVRKAINYLVRFSRREQNVVLPVSIATQLGEEAWRRGLADGEWRVEVSEPLLAGSYHVRLRGVTAFVETTEQGGYSVWRVDIGAPSDSFVVHHPLLAGGEAKRVPLDRYSLPVVSSSRSASRTAERAADVCGVATLHNASPFGNWRVQVPARAANSALARDQITDVQLDLHLALLR